MNIAGVVLLLGGIALSVYLAIGLVKDFIERKNGNQSHSK